MSASAAPRPRADLRERIGGARPLVLDGGVGTELLATGGGAPLGPGPPALELLNLTAPERILAVHRAFLDAGCDAITTNTFLGLEPDLVDRGLGGRARELTLAGARLARAAADACAGVGPPRSVLGSLGPGRRLPSRGEIAPGALRDAYAEQAGALLEGGVDGLLIETCRDPAQLRAALEGSSAALRGADLDLPLWVSLAPLPDGDPRQASALAAAWAALEGFPVDLVAVNCSNGPRALAAPLAVLGALRAAGPGPRRLGAYPNAGLPRLEGARPRYPVSPEAFAAELAAAAREHGLALVGGCCGTTPAHLARLVAELARDPDPHPKTP